MLPRRSYTLDEEKVLHTLRKSIRAKIRLRIQGGKFDLGHTDVEIQQACADWRHALWRIDPELQFSLVTARKLNYLEMLFR